MVLLACATIVWIASFVSPLLAMAADATAENGITNSTLMIARHGIATKGRRTDAIDARMVDGSLAIFGPS